MSSANAQRSRLGLTAGRRRWWLLIVAAIGPFLTLQLVSRIGDLFTPVTSPAQPVRHFSDYITSPSTPVTTISLHVLWEAESSEQERLRDIATISSAVAAATDHRLLLIDRATGAVRNQIEWNRTGLSSTASLDIAPGSSPGDVWVYDPSSGRYASFSFIGGDRPPGEMLQLERSLFTPRWLHDRIVAACFCEHELLHVLSRRARRAEATFRKDDLLLSDGGPMPTVLHSRIGRPLFPGVIPNFSRQLNVTTIDVSVPRGKVVVAFKWSNRIDVYSSDRLRLERSVAGPVETKLDFAIDHFRGKPIFTVSDETMYTYVDVVGMKRGFIALFAGRERRKYPGRAGYGSQIQAFTWEGELIGEWNLSEPVLKIAVDEREAAIYAIGSQREAILTADIGSLLEQF